MKKKNIEKLSKFIVDRTYVIPSEREILICASELRGMRYPPLSVSPSIIHYMNFMLLGAIKTGDLEPRELPILTHPPSKEEVRVFHEVFSVNSTFDIKKPSIGFEIEQAPEFYETRLLWQLLGGHHEYYGAYEVLLPPMHIDGDKNYCVWKNALSDLKHFVSEYYETDDEDSYNACGSHTHVCLPSSPMRSPKLWAKTINTLISLLPIFAPFFSNPYVYVDGKVRRIETGNRYSFRRKVWYWCHIPAYVIADDIINVSQENARKLKPDDMPNSYYAVQLNRYRKSIATIEIRVNEAHPLQAWCATWLMVRYAEIIPRSPLFCNLEDLYKRTITTYSAKINDTLELDVIRGDDKVFTGSMTVNRVEVIKKIYKEVSKHYTMPKKLLEVYKLIIKDVRLPDIDVLKQLM